MLLAELDAYFSNLFSPEEFAGTDPSWNGLQVGDFNMEIKKIAFAVDACMESFSYAVEQKADLLFVHHGIFWGKGEPLVKNMFDRIKFLIEHELALYAMHLPLDAHEEVGNNKGLIDCLKLEKPEAFGDYGGRKIGYKGKYSKPISLDEVLDRMGIGRTACSVIYPFGKDKISSVGVISGGAANDVKQALDENLDLFISGEGTHQVYHTCLEGKINMISAGHYYTERYGVMLTAKKCAEDTSVDTQFLEIPTGL